MEYATTDPVMHRALATARGVFFGRAAGPRPSDAPDMAEARLLDWFVFDHRPGDGEVTPLDLYLRIHGSHLAGDHRGVVRDFRYSVYSVFEVVHVEPGHGVRLRDLADDTEYPVRERAASTVLTPGAYVLGRILPFGDEHVLSAALSIWSRDAAETVQAAFARARRSAGSLYVSPLDVERLFHAALALPRPTEAPARAQRTPVEDTARTPMAEHPAPESSVREAGLPTTDELRAYAALATNALEVLDLVRQYHAVHTPQQLRQVMDQIHGIMAEGDRPREAEPSTMRVRVPAGAGPRERVLMRMFAAVAEREIDPPRVSDPGAARAALRDLQRRWLDTRQEHLDSLSPREIIERERARMGSCAEPLP